MASKENKDVLDKNEEIFLDTRTGTYTKEREIIMPPETYIHICRGEDGIIIETWVGKVEGESELKCLSIAYPSSIYRTEDHNELFKGMCKKNNFKATYMKRYTCPKEEYIKICKLCE